MSDNAQSFLATMRGSVGSLARAPARVALRPLLLAGAIVAAAAAAWAWFFWPVPLATITARIGPVITAVYASGQVESTVMVPVAPRVGARLASLVSDERRKVVKGEVLARLESEDLAGNIAQLQAQAEFARRDYERYARLMGQDATARQTYDRALASWRAANAAVRQARAQAGFMTLTAPAACQVISRDGEVGQFIAANAPIFWLACSDKLRVSAQVDEEDIRLVRPGQQVAIRADAFAGRVFFGKVTEITPKGDPVGRSYRVRIGLPDGTPLKIGMTVENNIVIQESKSALLLPSDAVANGQVWVVRDGHAYRQSVTTGVRSGRWVEVVRGLTRGDKVLPNAQSGPPPPGLRRLLQSP